MSKFTPVVLAAACGDYDSSSLLGLAVEVGNNGEPNYVVYLLQGGLGLRDRESCLGTEPPAQALRTELEGSSHPS